MKPSNETGEAPVVRSSDVLACPFCGGAAEIEEIDGVLGVRKSVGCSTESCQGYQSTATFATRREATTAWNQRAAKETIEEACHAMNDAWRDMLEWQQLAVRIREELKAAGKDPDREPLCPHAIGIATSEHRQKRLGLAITGLSALVYPGQANQKVSDERP